MKKTYKIEERRYSDGSSRFYPKVHTWWDGWRYYADKKVSDGVVEFGGKIWFDSNDKANKWLLGQMAADKGLVKSTPHGDNIPIFVEAIDHQVNMDEFGK